MTIYHSGEKGALRCPLIHPHLASPSLSRWEREGEVREGLGEG